jgi:hypothetical protein
MLKNPPFAQTLKAPGPWAGPEALPEESFLSCDTAFRGQVPVNIHTQTTWTDHIRNVIQVQPGTQLYLATFSIHPSDTPSCVGGAVPYALHLQPRTCQTFNKFSQSMADCSKEPDWTVTAQLQLHFLQKPDGHVDISTSTLHLSSDSNSTDIADMAKEHCVAPKSCLARARRMLHTVAQQLSVR